MGRPRKKPEEKKVRKLVVPDTLACLACQSICSSDDFYNSKNVFTTKYQICKKCVKKKLEDSNFDLMIVHEILKELNAVFLQEVWDSCKTTDPQFPFARYIRMINSLPQYKHLVYEDGLNYIDTQRRIQEISLIEERQQKLREKANKQAQESAINNVTAIELDYMSRHGVGTEDEIKPKKTKKSKKNKVEQQDSADNMIPLSNQLESKIYNGKWLGEYTPSELQYLERYLTELRRDFKITNTNHMDYAKKIAKASLAMDLAFADMMNGGMGDGVRKESKYKVLKETFDTLCKSAQFSENQRGASDVGLGNFGVIFDKVEKNAYVYEFKPDHKDIYDQLLDQFSNIKKSL